MSLIICTLTARLPEAWDLHDESEVKEIRHEIDMIAQVDVTEHELITIPVCPICGEAKTGSFPAEIKAVVQYGQNLEALAVALNTIGAVSFNRTHDILSGVFNVPILSGR